MRLERIFPTVLHVTAGLLIAAAAVAPTRALPEAAAAMTNEDVVRMVQAHMPDEEIVKAIKAATSTAFDLDPEVVAELREAGVQELIIQAMRKAQAASQPVSAAPEPAARGAAETFELAFQGDEKEDVSGRTAVLPAKDYNDRPTSIAFYIACVDSLHVPDLWEKSTPLFGLLPRHQMLWFHEATLPYKKESRKGGRVLLDLPRSVRIGIEPGIHPLELGVVARSGDRPWGVAARASTTLEVSAGRPARIVVRVRTRRAGLLRPGAGSGISCEVVSTEPSASGTPADPNAVTAVPRP